MIVTYEGKMGKGKSVSMTAMAYEQALQTGQTLVANYKLTVPYTHLYPKEFAKLMETSEIYNCIILLDEAAIYMNARRSMSSVNNLFNMFLAQTRKRHCDLFVATHNTKNVDRILRDAVQFRVRPRMADTLICEKDGEQRIVPSRLYERARFSGIEEDLYGKAVEYICYLSIRDVESGEITKKKFNACEYFWLYDTDEKPELPANAKNIKF